jgi:uncharacterized membrane protein (UPF0127 family)
MTLLNETRGTVLSRDLKKLSGFSESARGLLNSSNPRSLMLSTRFGIHTFFMKEAIDVLVLDENLTVRKIRSSLKPFRFFFWNPAFSNVIELPEGAIEKSDTMQGDKLVAV